MNEKSEILLSIEYITNNRDILIRDYTDLIFENTENDYYKISSYRERIDKLNKQIRLLEDCLIIVRLVKSGKIDFDIIK